MAENGKKGGNARDGNNPRNVTETDLAGRKMGENSLQGDDQHNVHNQRHAVPDEKTETDDIIEGLEKMDKDERARRESGKKDPSKE